jgi:flagellar protein FlaG
MSINITNQISVSSSRQDPVAVKKSVSNSTSTPDPQVNTRQDLPSTGNSVPSVSPTSKANIAGSVGASRSEEQQEKLQSEVVSQAVSDINDYVQTLNRSLEFTVDDELGETIIKVIDRETEEVVRQIPSKEVVDLARHLKEIQEQLPGGILIEAQA